MAIALVVACGSEDSSTFGVTPPGDDAGASSSSSSGGTFNTGEGGVDSGPTGSGSCIPKTCQEQGIECGPAGDGCGNLIPDCGKCDSGKRCGGPGAPSKCVSPTVGTGCVPKTCQDLNIGCGKAGDGCGGVLTCPTCPSGQQCGNNTTPSQCVPVVPTAPDGGACVPLTKADYTAKNMDCGQQTDGCGSTIDLGTCTDPEFCGGGGPSKCAIAGGGTCVPKDCSAYPGKCGKQSDGCGGLTADCGTCTYPQICGGGGTPSICGGGTFTFPDGGSCIPKTCATGQCGFIADGCGGTIDCGSCTVAGQLCGGAGTANMCGAPPCTKISQATACGSKNCGTVSDGCGGTYTCGTCTAPAICGGGGTPNVCGGGVVTTDGGVGGGACTPKTKAQACSFSAKSCGTVADGCGGTVDCGTCTSPELCGAGSPAVANVCGGGNQCTPKTQTAACGTFTCGYAPDGCGGYYTCGSNGGSCPTGESCGIYSPNQCGSLKGPCQTTGGTCTTNDQCCSGSCGSAGTCLSGACLNIGTACTTANQCCSGKCSGGFCATNNTNSCLASGSTCSSDSQCCSKGCINNVCSTATSYCKQNGDTCTDSTQCCGGKCSGNTTTPGICSTVNAPGGGVTCTIAGTVVACSTTGSTSYACNTDCCSGSCGGNDSATGYAICQHPQGCSVQGELCKSNTDCCGYPTSGSLVCSKPNGAGANDYGRCNSENSCSKPGQVCKTATDACSFPNNCCEPSDFKDVYGSGGCNNNPDGCCRHDILGVPRCVQYAKCRDAGQSCSTSADCCTLNGEPVPCTGGVCASATCISDGQACTVDKDCCNGNCYKANPLDLTGTCKIPTCTKKTCADYPGKCGYQSDGCGDVIRDGGGNPLSCGDCVYPQTCGGGGVANVCGGTICTPRTTCPTGYNCGDYPDGCGGTVHCGDCVDPDTCGGGGTAYVCGHPTCNSLNCTQQGIQCGYAGDGCGTQIYCGDCPSGQTCGGGGPTQLNKCGAPSCTALTSCPAGKNCGDYPDGCGGSIHCGDCPAGQTCGGGGSINVCGSASCTTKTCAQVLNPPAGSQVCGVASDGCGSTQNCGTCPMGSNCINNLCVATTCTPKTCEQLGAECGIIADGCGGLADSTTKMTTDTCGNCPAGQGCGAGGVPNKCGTNPCTPKTCTDLGAQCGQVADGCGGLTPDCGTCSGTQSCKNGACVTACTPLTCQQAGADCGYIADGCGGTVDCGVCPAGSECGYGGKANVCGQYQPK